MPDLDEETSVPRRRHVRRIVSRLHVNLTAAEARMLDTIQQDWDLPLAQLIRVMIREEYRRSYGSVPTAFPELETGT